MLAHAPVIVDFWTMPWSKPFRAACRWFTPETQPLRGRKANTDAPNWLRPLFLHGWVGKAIAARLAWLEAHPQAERYRYGKESQPCWDAVAWTRYEPRHLRQFDEGLLLWLFGMEVERLLRIAEEHPGVAGGADWTCAALGASEHLAQVYAELRRRNKAMPARALLREALRRFVEWDGDALPGDGWPQGQEPGSGSQPDVG